VIERSARQLYELLSPHMGRGKNYSIRVSNVLIHNEKVYDLLGASPLLELQVTAAQDGSILVNDLSDFPANSVEQCLELVERGEASRADLKGRLPASDSHVILHFKIESGKRCRHGRVRRMNLTFGDLAGSERFATHEDNLTASSLRTFTQIVSLLSSGSTSGLPYHESKLTTLLQHALHPSSFTCYIHTISPAQRSITATEDSLKFLSKTSTVPLRSLKRGFPASPGLAEYRKEEVESFKNARVKLPLKVVVSVKSRPDLMMAEMEELLQAEACSAQEGETVMWSSGKGKGAAERYERASNDFIRPTAEETSFLSPSESSPQLSRGTGPKASDFPSASPEKPPNHLRQTLPNSPVMPFNRSSVRSPTYSVPVTGNLDLGFDRMIISSMHSKDSRRQRQFDTVRQAAISADSRLKPSPIFQPPADSEAVKRRIEAEIRKLEEEKAAQQRRLEDKIHLEQEEFDEFRKKLNRRPFIEPRPQRPTRKGSQNLLID